MLHFIAEPDKMDYISHVYKSGSWHATICSQMTRSVIRHTVYSVILPITFRLTSVNFI